MSIQHGPLSQDEIYKWIWNSREYFTLCQPCTHTALRNTQHLLLTDIYTNRNAAPQHQIPHHGWRKRWERQWVRITDWSIYTLTGNKTHLSTLFSDCLSWVSQLNWVYLLKTRTESRHRSHNIIFMFEDSYTKSLIESRSQIYHEWSSSQV